MGKKRSGRRRSRPSAGKRETTPGTTAAARRGRETTLHEGWWALGIALLAGLHRILFLLADHYRDWPFSFFYEGDSETFFRWARAILADRLYDSGIPFHPPGFAYFLAGVHRLVGAGGAGAEVPHFTVRCLLAVIGGATIGLLYLLVRPYLGHVCALLTALLATYHFGLYILSVAPVTEVLYLALLMVTLLLFSRKLTHPLAAHEGAGSRPWGWGLVLGLLLGCLALTRAESMLLVPLVLAVAAYGVCRRAEHRQPRVWLPWGLLVVGWLLVVTPWTLENRRNLQELNRTMGPRMSEPLPTFVPVTLYAPLNLALANHGDADGTFSRDLISSQMKTGRLELTDPQHLEFLLHGDRLAWAWISDHPGEFVVLVLRRWRLAGRAWQLGWTQWNWPGGWVGERGAVDLFVPDSRRGLWFLPLYLVGFVQLWRAGGRSRRFLGLIALPGLVVLASTAMFFGYARQGLLWLPFSLAGLAVCLVAGAQWLEAWRRREPPAWRFDRAPKWLLYAVAATVCLLLGIEFGARHADRHFKATGVTIEGRSTLNRDLPVRLEPLP